MFRVDHLCVLGGVVSILVLAGSPLVGQDAAQPAAQVAAGDAVPSPHDKVDFAGSWDYSADDSIDIRTGRSEQRPRSATQRGGGATTGRGSSGPGSRSGTGGGEPAAGSSNSAGAGSPEGGGGGGGGRGGNVSGVGPTPEMMREARDMARDLLEVAERLTIKVEPTRVTITDDLERERVYTTDGRKERHQIAASKFDTRTDWRDSQLIQQIEGSYDFKMSQTYFLSPDGNRLFLMVRVGQPRKGVPQVGFNRVYDRIQ